MTTPNIKNIIQKVMSALRSRRGHDLLVLLAFLAVSTVLWFVLALNDEEQCDIRMPFRLTNIPDSVTLVSTPPTTVSVSLRARGSQRLKLGMSSAPSLDVDFRMFRNGNAIRLSNADLKACARNSLNAASVLLVSPDSLNLYYTSNKGSKVPVSIDYSVTAGPRATVIGRPVASLDSVNVYSVRPLRSGLTSISTEPIRLTNLDENTTVRTRLVPPPGARAIPDSIDVTFTVEPLILKTRKVMVDAVNVPHGLKLITFPAQATVVYMIPMSAIKTSEPHMRVIADYRAIDHANPSRNMVLRLADVSPELRNVHLQADSAEYIIEHL